MVKLTYEGDWLPSQLQQFTLGIQNTGLGLSGSPGQKKLTS